MSKREQMEKIEHALREISSLMDDLYEHRKSKLAKRADTIISKLLELQYYIDRE